jgi:AcrR family transcriptional regulator
MAVERGRPRSFDLDEALGQAMQVFWKHGFQAASFSELTRVTGLSKPSLYAAFGDKESLYLKALQKYENLLIENQGKQLNEEPNARRAIETFLNSVAEVMIDPQMPGGCFIVNGSADCDGDALPEAIEQALQTSIQCNEKLLKERLVRAKQDGELPEGTEPETLAAFLACVTAGLAVQAKTGAGLDKLKLIIQSAMKVWA